MVELLCAPHNWDFWNCLLQEMSLAQRLNNTITMGRGGLDKSDVLYSRCFLGGFLCYMYVCTQIHLYCKYCPTYSCPAHWRSTTILLGWSILWHWILTFIRLFSFVLRFIFLSISMFSSVWVDVVITTCSLVGWQGKGCINAVVPGKDWCIWWSVCGFPFPVARILSIFSSECIVCYSRSLILYQNYFNSMFELSCAADYGQEEGS